MRTCFVFGLVVLTSCDLYFGHAAPDAGTTGGDDAADLCGGEGGGGGGGGRGGGGGGTPGIDRDPTTGNCLPAPCPPPPEPTFAACIGPCEQLSETACLSTPGCHPTYADTGGIEPRFNACWDIAPLTVTEGSTCAQADAQACSTRDDCASLMAEASPQNQFNFVFAACQRKPVYTCPSDCQPFEASQTACNIACDADDCNATCLPLAATGTCNGSAVTCGSAAPDCPIGTSAGVVAGCWTGYCLPDEDCL